MYKRGLIGKFIDWCERFYRNLWCIIYNYPWILVCRRSVTRFIHISIIILIHKANQLLIGQILQTTHITSNFYLIMIKISLCQWNYLLKILMFFLQQLLNNYWWHVNVLNWNGFLWLRCKKYIRFYCFDNFMYHVRLWW